MRRIYFHCLSGMALLVMMLGFEETAQAQVNQAWVARFNGQGNGNDEARAVAADNNGNVHVTGFETGTGSGNTDYVTIKYDAAIGAELWTPAARFYNGAGSTDGANALAVDNAGDIFVTGASFGGSATQNDFATVKYDAAGNQVWGVRYTNTTVSGDDVANGIAVDDGGNVYVTGRSLGAGNDFATVRYAQPLPPVALGIPEHYILTMGMHDDFITDVTQRYCHTRFRGYPF